MKNISIYVLLLCCIAGFIIALPSAVHPEVFVYDDIVLNNEEIMLRAETKGVYFSKGGQVVEFFINGKSAGSALSGGDGVAFKPFKPRKSGINNILAKSKKDRGSGIIFSLNKGSSVILIDVEGSLLSASFSKEPIEKSRNAIKNIMKKHPVVYVHAGILGLRSIKEWLRKNKFPESAVVPWDMGSVFSELRKKNLKIKAVIGSQTFIESADEFKPKAFSFDEAGNAEKVKDWNEIERKLR